jgi:hypothetical protein
MVIYVGGFFAPYCMLVFLGRKFRLVFVLDKKKNLQFSGVNQLSWSIRNIVFLIVFTESAKVVR